MQLSKKIRLFLLVFVCCINAYGQEYLSTNITTNDGLPNNSVYSVFKDSRGILWIGTDNGVSKSVNGTLTNYYISNGLAHNSCWAIAEDRNNNLWFGSHGGGITFYNGNKFEIINTKKGLINNKIRRLFIRKNFVFVGTENGVSVIDIQTRKVIFSKKIVGKINKFQVMDFFEYRSKIYFSTFCDGVWNIDISKRKLTRQWAQFDGVFSVFQKDNNNLLVCHGDTRNKSISEYTTTNYLSGKNSSLAYGNTVFWNYTKDKRGQVFSAGYGVNFSTGGLFLLSNNKAINVSSFYGINSTEIWSLHYDKSNDIIYVGTIDKGLFTVDLSSKFEYYSPSYFQLKQIEIVGFENIKSKDIILHKKGVYFIQNKKITKTLSDEFFYKHVQNYKQTIGYKKGFPYYIQFKTTKLADVKFRKIIKFKNHLWISSNIGLFALDLNGKIVEYYAVDAESFFIDKYIIYYQTSYGGTNVIYSKGNYLSHEPIIKFQNQTSRNVNCGVSSIFKWKQLIYFVSESRGVFFWDGKVFNFFQNSKINNEIACSKWLNNNNLILANRIGEVSIIDLNKKNISIKDLNQSSIIGNTILFIETYMDEIIIGTNKGVNLISKYSSKFISNNIGLQENVILTGKVIKNRLYIGTLKGFFSINLDDLIASKTAQPNIQISRIEVNYKAINDTNYRWGYYQSKAVSLSYEMNNLAISFEALGDKSNDELVYRYKLKNTGLEKWSNWSATKTINFSFIPTGKYQLEIETKHQLTGRIDKISLLDIHIAPPFWETWIFYLISFSLLILFIVLFLKSRINKIKRQERAKSEITKRLAETKMEALQSQMNPHFIFNALNSIQNFVIDNKTDDALKYIGEFSKLIRQTLEFSSKQSVLLSEEIAYLERYIALENLRRNKEVECVISNQIHNVPNTIEIPPLLIQPIVENVFIHAFDSQSKNPKIQIEFDCKNDVIICSIIDNGKGFNKDSDTKQSKGIKLVDERIRLLTGANEKMIQILPNPTGGTTIILTIPMR
ncbi:MAG: histidine kinase [Flavobacterium psychrophilum]